METGAFGWGFQDKIQPILDEYDRQIENIRRNGAEGQLARMQAQDDALGINAGGNELAYGGTPMPMAGSNQQGGSWYQFISSDNPGRGAPSSGSNVSGAADSPNRSKLFGA